MGLILLDHPKVLIGKGCSCLKSQLLNTLMGGKGSGSVSSASVSSGTGSLILISTEVGEGAFDLDAVIIGTR